MAHRGWRAFMESVGVKRVVQMVTYRATAEGTIAEGTVPPVVGRGAPFRPPGVPGVGWFDEETFGKRAVENAFDAVLATGKMPRVTGIFIAGRGRPNVNMHRWKGWAHRIDVYARTSGSVVIGPIPKSMNGGGVRWMGSLRMRAAGAAAATVDAAPKRKRRRGGDVFDAYD